MGETQHQSLEEDLSSKIHEIRVLWDDWQMQGRRDQRPKYVTQLLIFFLTGVKENLNTKACRQGIEAKIACRKNIRTHRSKIRTHRSKIFKHRWGRKNESRDTNKISSEYSLPLLYL